MGKAERWEQCWGSWHRVPTTSDVVKSERESGAVHEAWGQAATRTKTGAPWVLVVILLALTVLLGLAVWWLLNARSSAGVPAVTPNETTKQVLGGQTSTDPGVDLASSTGADRDVEVNAWKAEKAWLMKHRTRFLQDVLEAGSDLNRRCVDLYKIISTYTESLTLRRPFSTSVRPH